ncbi:MAG: hypothetical protein MI975_10535 [Cytophagales bacterium]|nr:hypothetical protein [Cytophagales bacterium]
MNVFANRKTRALIFIMCALVLSGIIISHFYYKGINASIDPRVVPARKLYERYNQYAQLGQYDSVLWLLDTIQSTYYDISHYKSSFEVGVLQNNRAATFLTMGLFDDKIKAEKQDSLMIMADSCVRKSINLYENWLKAFDSKNEDQIRGIIKEDFLSGLQSFSSEDKERFLKNRIDEIKSAQIETKRRLSVAYTNLGIVNRYQLQYELAAQNYKTAIDLWDRNLTAENNLNKLLGRPEKKRNLIQKLFPPERVQN